MTSCSSHQERKDSGSSIAAAVTTSAAATAEAAASSVLAGTASSNSGFMKPSSGISPGDDLPSVFAKNVSKIETLRFLYVYRVTHQEVPNLLLTSKQKLF